MTRTKKSEVRIAGAGWAYSDGDIRNEIFFQDEQNGNTNAF